MRKMSIPSSIRHALRSLRTNWGFAALFVLTLALGLTCVSTIFSVLNTVMLRPLPFTRADRLVTITQTVPFMGSGPQICTIDEFQRWQKSALLDYAAAINTMDLTLTGGDRAELLSGAKVTPDFFRVFGISPFLGRDFRQEDAVPGHEQVIILSHELWARRFDSNPAIVGKTIQFSGATMTVIGVAPPRFDFPRLADVGAVMRFAPAQTEFWTPLVITQKIVDANNYSYYVIGRLHSGILRSRAAAQFRISAIQSLHYIVEKNPQYREPLEHLAKIIAIQVTPLSESMAWGVRNALWMLIAAVTLLLLLVLFNLGNLLVTRNANRLREYAIRQALGETRWRLFRQALVEQGILVALASVLSLSLSIWTIELVRKIGSVRVPRLYELSLDTHTIALLLGLGFATALIFGALPLIVIRPDSVGWFGSESRSSTGDRRAQRLRAALIAAEVAVSMVLLVSAGLLTASFVNVMNVEPGFDPKSVLTFSVSFSPKLYADPPKLLTTQRELLDRIRAIPAVESASIVNALPLTGDYAIHGIGVVGQPLNRDAGAEARLIDPRYFETMHIPLIAGRALREDDSGSVAVINRKMARLLWPGENPVDRQFTDNGGPAIRVIGVVGNVHSGRLEAEPMMQYYSSFVTFPGYANSFAIRTRTDPLSLLPIIERTIWGLDPDLAVSGAKTMEQIMEAGTLERRFETGLLVGFSAAALFLSALGLFGVASLSAARRSREFGIRMALGATGADVLSLELIRNSAIVVAGLAVGLLLSVATHRALAALLFRISPLDLKVYAAAVAVLTISGLTAVLIPAFRASRMDPAIVLRDE